MDESNAKPLSKHERGLAAATEALILGMQGAARDSVEKLAAPDWEQAIEFFTSLADESNRAIPVLAFAYLDTEVEQQMRHALNPAVHGGINGLFGPLGPLGTASMRINMSHALLWITTETAGDFHTLRKIRNRYAHNLVDKGLEDPKTKDLLREHVLLPVILGALNLGVVDISCGLPERLDVDIDAKTTTMDLRVRNQLILAFAFTTWRVLAELHVAPSAIRTGVSPSALLDPESPSAPAAIVDQRKHFDKLIRSLVNLVSA